MSQSTATHYTYATIHGPVTIASQDGCITRICFGAQDLPGAKKPSTATNDAATQLQEYFAGKRFDFDLALAPEGTAYQLQVWSAIQTIPYGRTCTAAEIAGLLDSPKAHRSVGSAVAKNPIAIVIPTHRVTGGTQSGMRSQIDAGLRALEQSKADL